MTDRPTLVGVHHALQHADRVIRLQLQRGVAHRRHQLAEEVSHLTAVLQQHVAILPISEVWVAQVGPADTSRRPKQLQKKAKEEKNRNEYLWIKTNFDQLLLGMKLPGNICLN